jgi:FkbM family methyltransferase
MLHRGHVLRTGKPSSTGTVAGDEPPYDVPTKSAMTGRATAAIRSSLWPVHTGARRAYHALAQRLRKSEAELLSEIAVQCPDVYFIQIGAHDGKTGDHLHFFVRTFGWKGILLEPVRPLFESLRRNYEGVPGLTFENAALAEHDGTGSFFRVEAAGMPEWCSQLGSFRRDVIVSHKKFIPEIEQHLIEDHVICISFRTLVQKFAIQRLDIVLIDTEGYDLKVLEQIDFSMFQPRLIIYEQKHLSKSDKARASELLSNAGYRIHRIGNGWNNAALRKGH